MAWLTRVGDGDWRNSDDLTLDELAAIEHVADTGWAFLNPFRNANTARALLATWLVRDGKTDAEAQAAVSALTAKTLKHTFRLTSDDDLPDHWEDGLPVVDPKDQAAAQTD